MSKKASDNFAIHDSRFISSSGGVFHQIQSEVVQPGTEPNSFRVFSGSNCIVGLVRLVSETNISKYHNEIVTFKRNGGWAKLYLMKRKYENPRSSPATPMTPPTPLSPMSGISSQYYLEYLSNTGCRIKIQLGGVKGIKVEKGRLEFEIYDFGREKSRKTHRISFIFKFPSNQVGFVNILSKLLSHINNPEESKPFTFMRSSNRIVPDKKGYKKITRKENNIMTMNYNDWKRSDFLVWLSVLPLSFDKKKKKIVSIYDTLKSIKKPSALQLFENMMFEKNNVKVRLMKLRDQLQATNLPDLIKYPNKDETLRKAGMYLRKYLSILEYLSSVGTWSVTFQRVLWKLVINNEEDTEKKTLFDLLDWMMNKKIILWDPDETRDHVLALMFFERPFLNYEDSVPDETFGDVYRKVFWKHANSIIKEKKKKTTNINNSEEIEGEGEKEEEEEEGKRVEEEEVTWEVLKLDHLDYSSIGFDPQDDVLETFIDNEEEFVKKYLGLPTDPVEMMRIKKLIVESFGFELDKIDFPFYRKMVHISQAVPLWTSLLEMKSEVKRLHRKIKQVQKKAKEWETETDIQQDFDKLISEDGEINLDMLSQWSNDMDPDTEDDPEPGESEEELEEKLKESLENVKKSVTKIVELIRYGDPSNVGKNQMSPWQFIRSRERRKEIHKVLKDQIELHQSQQGVLEIVTKLVLSELECFEGIKMPFRRLFLNSIDKFLKISFFKFGFVHSSLVLKNVQFHWFANQFVSIKDIKRKDQQKEFFCVDCFCPLIATGSDLFDLIDGFCERIVIFNTFTPYDCWGVSQSKLDAKNCQQITLKLLEKLEYSRFYDLVEDYYEEIKKIINKKFNSTDDFPLRFLDLKWRGAQEFAKDERFKKVINEYLNVPKFGKTRIVFDTHKEVDEFLNKLLVEEPDFAYDFPDIFEILKGIDRGFWLLRGKTKETGVEPEKLEPMKDGCPFKILLNS